MYRNIVSVGVQCTLKVYMYRNIVPVVVRCTQKVYMYRNIVFVIRFCTLHVHFHSVCYRFLYIGCTISYNRHYENVRLISAIVYIRHSRIYENWRRFELVSATLAHQHFVWLFWGSWPRTDERPFSSLPFRETSFCEKIHSTPTSRSAVPVLNAVYYSFKPDTLIIT